MSREYVTFNDTVDSAPIDLNDRTIAPIRVATAIQIEEVTKSLHHEISTLLDVPPFDSPSTVSTCLLRMQELSLSITHRLSTVIDLTRAIDSTLDIYNLLECTDGTKNLFLMAMPQRLVWLALLVDQVAAQNQGVQVANRDAALTKTLSDFFDESDYSVPYHWVRSEEETKQLVELAATATVVYRLGAWISSLRHLLGDAISIPYSLKGTISDDLRYFASSAGTTNAAAHEIINDAVGPQSTLTRLEEIYSREMDLLLQRHFPDLPSEIRSQLRFYLFEHERGEARSHPAPPHDVWNNFEDMQRSWGAGSSKMKTLSNCFSSNQLSDWYYGGQDTPPGRSLLLQLDFQEKPLFLQIVYPNQNDMWPSTREVVNSTVDAQAIESLRNYGWTMLVASDREASKIVEGSTGRWYPRFLELVSESLYPYQTEILLGRVEQTNRALAAHLAAGYRDSGVTIDKDGIKNRIVDLSIASNPFKNLEIDSWLRHYKSRHAKNTPA